jgi:hypothetical protein
MGKRIAGTCYIKVDGDQLEVKGGVEIAGMPVTREAVMSTAGVAGFKETVRVPSVKLTAIVGANFPLKKLQEGTDMTVTSELANGMAHTLSSAFLVGDPSIKAEDGEIDLEFNGVKGIWQ